VAAKIELKGDDRFMSNAAVGQVDTISKTKMDWFQTLERNRYVVLVFRLIIAAFFLTSAYGKLVDIERYSVDAVYNFGILPMFLARPFGLVMPFIELLCGLGLLFGVLTRLSALGIALMSVAFFIAKGIVLSQGRSIECGCFGAVVDTLASVTIFMDIPVMILALVIMFATPEARHWLAIGKFLPSQWKEKLNLVW
jgi:putative oxidoreductase